MNSACVIIPARYASRRFPGKPLVPLLGTPMVLRVAERAARAVGRDHVYIATEDRRIAETADAAGFRALMTSPAAPTGMDRVAEAARMVAYDIYINVQGDEPLVDPDDIRRCIALKAGHPGLVINAYSWMSPAEDPDDVHIPKVVTCENDMMIYISRKAVPGSKSPEDAPRHYKKQVCIYGVDSPALAAYAAFGRKSAAEAHEDIEILRFLDIDRQILMYEARPGSLAVDRPEDVARAEAALRAHPLPPE